MNNMEEKRTKDLLARMILWQVESGIPFRQVLKDLAEKEIGMTANEVAEIIGNKLFNRLYKDNVKERVWDFPSHKVVK